MRLVLILVVAIGGVRAATAHDDVGRADYLGNEGVLISACGASVLFDAFYDDSYGIYTLVPDEVRTGMNAGTSPYDGVSAVFVSHVHGDHFSPGPTLEYLRARPDVLLFGPGQVADALSKAAGSADGPVMSRVVAVEAKPGSDPVSLERGELAIDAVAVPHSGGARHAGIRNLVFRVTIRNAFTVLHMGDAAVDDEVFAIHQGHWDAKRNNIAFPPYWFLMQEPGLGILERRIRADTVIGIHVPSEATGRGDHFREEVGADLFTDPGESRMIAGTSACGPMPESPD